MTWAEIFGQWSAVECDLQDRGVDVSSERVLYGRSWRWLRTRILGLLTAPHVYDPSGNPLFPTRLQTLLAPPPAQVSGLSDVR